MKAKLDELLTAVWLTGQDEAFHQIFHLIMSENVSGQSVLQLHLYANNTSPCTYIELLACDCQYSPMFTHRVAGP